MVRAFGTALSGELSGAVGEFGNRKMWGRPFIHLTCMFNQVIKEINSPIIAWLALSRGFKTWKGF